MTELTQQYQIFIVIVSWVAINVVNLKALVAFAILTNPVSCFDSFPKSAFRGLPKAFGLFPVRIFGTRKQSAHVNLSAGGGTKNFFATFCNRKFFAALRTCPFNFMTEFLACEFISTLFGACISYLPPGHFCKKLPPAYSAYFCNHSASSARSCNPLFRSGPSKRNWILSAGDRPALAPPIISRGNNGQTD
jgi:hypothetical protein